jgi:hypothetical protein
MAIVIVVTCIVARGLHLAASRALLRKTQAWKRTRSD